MIDFQFKRGILCKRILMAKTTRKNNFDGKISFWFENELPLEVRGARLYF